MEQYNSWTDLAVTSFWLERESHLDGFEKAEEQIRLVYQEFLEGFEKDTVQSTVDSASSPSSSSGTPPLQEETIDVLSEQQQILLSPPVRLSPQIQLSSKGKDASKGFELKATNPDDLLDQLQQHAPDTFTDMTPHDVAALATFASKSAEELEKEGVSAKEIIVITNKKLLLLQYSSLYREMAEKQYLRMQDQLQRLQLRRLQHVQQTNFSKARNPMAINGQVKSAPDRAPSIYVMRSSMRFASATEMHSMPSSIGTDRTRKRRREDDVRATASCIASEDILPNRPRF